ncbi:hypothetical protein [Actinophytocola sp.]|uniref:hypothetical protein n=1 Tax=Actinophytocola sp. TaxID=1872138 RepID=UPI003D6C330A
MIVRPFPQLRPQIRDHVWLPTSEAWENFYRHVEDWLAGRGVGALFVVVDNSPPELAAADVVVRYTRNRAVPPYGLIDDAVD